MFWGSGLLSVSPGVSCWASLGGSGSGVSGLGFTYSHYSLHCSSFFLVSHNLYYRILTIKLVNQKRNYNGHSR